MITKIAVQVTDETNYFKLVANWMNICFNFKLTKYECLVLAELLYRNNLLKEQQYDLRMEMIFSKPTRRDMYKKLKIQEGTFNNVLVRLRDISSNFGYILTNKFINKEYLNLIEDENIFAISVKVKPKLEFIKNNEN